jgi:hypothetical protein
MWLAEFMIAVIRRIIYLLTNYTQHRNKANMYEAEILLA